MTCPAGRVRDDLPGRSSPSKQIVSSWSFLVRFMSKFLCWGRCKLMELFHRNHSLIDQSFSWTMFIFAKDKFLLFASSEYYDSREQIYLYSQQFCCNKIIAQMVTTNAFFIESFYFNRTYNFCREISVIPESKSLIFSFVALSFLSSSISFHYRVIPK